MVTSLRKISENSLNNNKIIIMTTIKIPNQILINKEPLQLTDLSDKEV